MQFEGFWACHFTLSFFGISLLTVLGLQKFWFLVRPYPSRVLHTCRISKDVATHNGSTLGACREGYTDVMCMDCAPKYFATGNQCERCHDSAMFSKSAPITVAAIVVILVAMGGGISLWMHRNARAEVRQGPSASGALKEQLKAQLPILLQLCDSVMTVSYSPEKI